MTLCAVVAANAQRSSEESKVVKFVRLAPSFVPPAFAFEIKVTKSETVREIKEKLNHSVW